MQAQVEGWLKELLESASQVYKHEELHLIVDNIRGVVLDEMNEADLGNLTFLPSFVCLIMRSLLLANNGSSKGNAFFPSKIHRFHLCEIPCEGEGGMSRSHS